jgi:hypothetical protein
MKYKIIGSWMNDDNTSNFLIEREVGTKFLAKNAHPIDVYMHGTKLSLDNSFEITFQFDFDAITNN